MLHICYLFTAIMRNEGNTFEVERDCDAHGEADKSHDNTFSPSSYQFIIVSFIEISKKLRFSWLTWPEACFYHQSKNTFFEISILEHIFLLQFALSVCI